MKLTPNIQLALEVSAKAHQAQIRKATDIPYVTHPVAVMIMASEVTDDEATLCACLLHDVIEDCDPKLYNRQTLTELFGETVVSTVLAVTKDGGLMDWRERSESYINHIKQTDSQRALVVCAADKLHNLTTTLADFQKGGDKVWSRFNSSKDEQLWWYQSVYHALNQRIPENDLVKQLRGRVAKLETISSLR